MSDFRRRLMCKKIESGLPSGYTRLNYLESTGTQYIDLGVTPYYVENKQLIVDYKILDDFTENVVLFGATNGNYYCWLFAYTIFDKIGLQWANVGDDIYRNLYINLRPGNAIAGFLVFYQPRNRTNSRLLGWLNILFRSL